jgi:methionine-rich copper-binding protein CopC
MPYGRHGFRAALMAATCLAGCAGNGNGLDQNGQPLSSDSAPAGGITADFQSIQDNVFTPICSKCHIGASAPEGLQLDAAHSYNLLVGVPSAEQPNLLRVKPGDPDDSYMVHKIEGLSGIDGGQMPLNETPLPQATIDAIRQWTTNGAPNAPAAAVAQEFAVQATEPQDGTSVTQSPARLVVTFTQEVDASLVNATTVVLSRIGAGMDAASGLESISADAALSPSNGAVLLVTPRTALAPGVYRVTLRGAGGGALATMNSVTLGLDHSFEFTVESDR